MQQSFVVPLIVLLFVEPTRSCKGPDCQKWDCGTCGAPCCTLTFFFPKNNPKDVATTFAKTIIDDDLPGPYTPIDFQCQGASEAVNYTKIRQGMMSGWYSWKSNAGTTKDYTPKSKLGDGVGLGAVCDCGMYRETSGDGFGGHKFRDHVSFAVWPGKGGGGYFTGDSGDTENTATIVAHSMTEEFAPWSSSADTFAKFHCDWGQSNENIMVVMNAIKKRGLEFKEVDRRGCSIEKPDEAPRLFKPKQKLEVEDSPESGLQGVTLIVGIGIVAVGIAAAAMRIKQDHGLKEGDRALDVM